MRKGKLGDHEEESVRVGSPKVSSPRGKGRAREQAVAENTSLGKLGLDATRLKRAKPPDSEEEDVRLPDKSVSVSAGPIDRVIELAFNPTRDKIREVTIIDRMQGRLFPIMDSMNRLFGNCVEVATFRQSKSEYKAWYGKPKPEPLDIVDEMMFRIAQWQKSVAGKNLERATDIALAETETRAPEDEDYSSSGRGFED